MIRNTGQRLLLLWTLLAFALILVFKISTTTSARNELDQQQDVMRLDNRITQIEQRIFSLETTLRNVEQQSRLATVPSRGGSQDELARLRSDVDALQRRLGDYDCALAKLDERTLTPQKRELRRRSGGDPEPCRQNFDAPLRLP